MRFTMAGVTCAPPRGTGAVEVLLRTSEDGRTWSRWYTVALERVAEEGGAEKAFTEPIWTGSGRYLQVSARRAGDTGSAPARLRDVRVVAINSTEDADRASAVVGVIRRAAATVAGFHLTQTAAAMTTKPQIVTRSEWGANESWRSGSPDYAPVKMAFVHHTDSGNDYSAAEAPAIMRGVYAYHTKSLHWSDVGYNFLIDRYGTIYEGRFGGVTRGVIGAQVLGFNTGSTGISVIGTFTSATPPSAAVIVPGEAARVEAGRPSRRPAGHRHPRLRLRAEVRHRSARDVPGHRRASRRQLHGLPRRAAVRPAAQRAQGRGPHRPAQDLRLHRGGPGDQPQRRRRAASARPSASPLSQTADLAPRDPRTSAGKLVRSQSGEGTVVETTWAGRDDAGKLQPDGVYSLQVDATSADGEARSATATLRLDTVAPDIESAGIAPDPFSPNGDGQDDDAVLDVRAGRGRDRARVRRRRRRHGLAPRDGLGRGHHVRAEGPVGRPHLVRLGPHGGARRRGHAAPGAPRRGRQHHDARRRKVTVDRTLKLTSVSRKTFSPNGDGVNDAVTLSFRLTRAADVTATVVRSGSTVRTMRLGRLAAGARTVDWDGKLGGGGVGDERRVLAQGVGRRRASASRPSRRL